MVRCILPLVTLILISLPSSAARALTGDSNANLWINYVGDHPFTAESPWGLHLEMQNRRSDFGDEWQQLLVRPGVNYQISPTLSASAGWAYVRTYPYGDFPVVTEFPEHRAWQQLQHQFRFLGLEWTQRLRLEQRWIGEMALTPGSTESYDFANWRYENRLRYLLRTNIPLGENGKTYLTLWDEVFFNFGSNVSGNDFDQNRAFIGIGRKLTANTRLEMGYMEQTVRRRGGQIREDNHTLTVWLSSKAPLFR